MRRLRHERRAPTVVLLSVRPSVLALHRMGGATLAEYTRDRLRYVGCGADGDRRHFALLTRSPPPGVAHGCHVFMVDVALADHRAHADRALTFRITCTLDPISGRCLEFPADANYVVDVVRCMYSLPVRARVPSSVGPSPACLPHSPQPSNHSEPATGSSNSDSGIGFHTECPAVADRVLLVEFAREPAAPAYDPVHTDSEGHYYETIGPRARARFAASCSDRGELRRVQTSLDDILLVRDGPFLRPGDVLRKLRRPFPASGKCKNSIFGRRERQDSRPLSSSVGDMCAASGVPFPLANASSAPDLRGQGTERSSPFRRWTTAASGGSVTANEADTNAGAAGRVARWSLGLDQLLSDAAGAAAFAAFLTKEFAAENIRFWWACERYAGSTENARSAAALAVWERHLADGAPEPVNVDASARRAADPRAYPSPPPADLFHVAQNQIFNLMKFDSYPRFLRSPMHAECARADLRGMPLPYAPDPDAVGDRGPTSADATPSKLKKSASNASERRRSGGSLLPWARLRAASRDRDTPPPAAENANVGGGGPMACSLCRVVLPDGATSVVGVEATLSVRALVDRLLTRRALSCSAYDVVVTEPDGVRCVDTEAPSTVLGGRQAAVERRCVFRLELGGRRAVAVRCRPGKRLRHVLKPVLAKYAPADDAEPVVLRDGQPVPLDTRVQEVDGARLQVACAECRPASTFAPLTPEHDDEHEHEATRRPPDGPRLATVRAALRPVTIAEVPRQGPRIPPPLPPKPRPPAPQPP